MTHTSPLTEYKGPRRLIVKIIQYNKYNYEENSAHIFLYDYLANEMMKNVGYGNFELENPFYYGLTVIFY